MLLYLYVVIAKGFPVMFLRLSGMVKKIEKKKENIGWTHLSIQTKNECQPASTTANGNGFDGESYIKFA